MKIRWASFGRRALKEESGQVFAVTGLGALLLVGLAGISIEVGHGYYALELLQASTDEATLAAASGLPSSSQATTNATNYSSETTDENNAQILQNLNLTVTPFCSTTIETVYNVPCEEASGSSSAYNAVKVTQTANTDLWIGAMFGTPLFSLEAVGTAAMAGGNFAPYNIALIMDTTGSMGDTDKSGDCGTGTITAEGCALEGFRQLLQDAYPCAAGQQCTTGTPTPDDAVALYVFPTITTTADEICSSGDPGVIPYTLPTTSGVYQVISFANGVTYRTSDTTPSLNTTDPLVEAAAGSTKCTGLQAKGGAHTYYAQVIYQAGADLATEQHNRPGTNNIMIILTDGNATATEQYDSTTKNGTTTWTLDSGSDMTTTTSGSTTQLNGLAHSLSTSNSPAIYTYPSAVGQCGQAVQAAYDVANLQTKTIQGTTITLNNSTSNLTKVYTIAYQSPNTSAGSGNSSTNNVGNGNCYSDIVYNASSNYWNQACTTAPCTVTLTTGGGIWPTGEAGYNTTGGSATVASNSPCAAIAAMASSPNYFYSDQGDGCPVTASQNAINPNGTSGGIDAMSQIFSKIINSLSSPKLVPLGTS